MAAGIAQLGDLMRQKRTEKELTLEKLSEQTASLESQDPTSYEGISPGYVSDVENAATRKRKPPIPSDKKMFTLSRVLDIPLMDLHAALGRVERETDYSDPLETIVAEAGFDSTEFTEEEKAQMRRSVDAVVIGLVEQQRRERMRAKGEKQ